MRVLILPVIAMILLACSSTVKQERVIPYKVEYNDFTFTAVRTDMRYDPDAPTVVLETIASFKDLQAYRAEHEDNFSFDYGFPNYPSFDEFIEHFDEAFFEDNHLVFIVIEENSGSNWHELNHVSLDGAVLTIEINRYRPYIGTDDMANWHLIIEVPHRADSFDDIEYEITTIIND